MLEKDKGSFRDPCGSVYVSENRVIHTINRGYKDNWELLHTSSLLETLLHKKAIIPFPECSDFLQPFVTENTCKCIEVKKIPFISCTYK